MLNTTRTQSTPILNNILAANNINFQIKKRKRSPLSEEQNKFLKASSPTQIKEPSSDEEADSFIKFNKEFKYITDLEKDLDNKERKKSIRTRTDEKMETNTIANNANIRTQLQLLMLLTVINLW